MTDLDPVGRSDLMDRGFRAAMTLVQLRTLVFWERENAHSATGFDYLVSLRQQDGSHRMLMDPAQPLQASPSAYLTYGLAYQDAPGTRSSGCLQTWKLSFKLAHMSAIQSVDYPSHYGANSCLRDMVLSGNFYASDTYRIVSDEGDSKIALQPTIAQIMFPQEGRRLHDPTNRAWAAIACDSKDAFHEALEAGADLTIVRRDNTTLLHAAAIAGAAWALDPLLSQVDVNAQDALQNTPLHWAARMRRMEVAAALLQAGADAQLRNKNRRTPLTIQGAPSQELARLVSAAQSYRAAQDVLQEMGLAAGPARHLT